VDRKKKTATLVLLLYQKTRCGEEGDDDDDDDDDDDKNGDDCGACRCCGPGRDFLLARRDPKSVRLPRSIWAAAVGGATAAAAAPPPLPPLPPLPFPMTARLLAASSWRDRFQVGRVRGSPPRDGRDAEARLPKPPLPPLLMPVGLLPRSCVMVL